MPIRCPVATRRTPRPTHLLAPTMLLMACNPPADPEIATVTDSAGIRIVTSHPMSSGATCTLAGEPTAVIGDDGSDETQWFSQVRGAGRLSDGSIVAADRSTAQVRVYDATGRHLQSMGRRGEGPGEFNDPLQLWVAAGDTIWVGDYRPWRYNLFTVRDGFVRRVNLTPLFHNSSRAGGVLDNGYTVNSRPLRVRENFTADDTMMVMAHDADGQLVDTIARLPDGKWGSSREAPNSFTYRLFEAFSEVDVRGSTVALAHGADTEVRVLDDAFELRLIVRWTEPEREVTGADVRAWREDYVAEREQPGYPEWDASDDFSISDDRPVADLFPAFSRVAIGRDGRIWVRQYDRPREARAWLGFERDGQFLCHLPRLPGSVEEFGADYVLLLNTNELGVETVRVYPFETPVGG